MFPAGESVNRLSAIELIRLSMLRISLTRMWQIETYWVAPYLQEHIRGGNEVFWPYD